LGNGGCSSHLLQKELLVGIEIDLDRFTDARGGACHVSRKIRYFM
jgi:hypothetical protein